MVAKFALVTLLSVGLQGFRSMSTPSNGEHMQRDEYKLGIGSMIVVGVAAILCGLVVTVWGISVSRSGESDNAVESRPVANESAATTTPELVALTATPTTTQAPTTTEAPSPTEAVEVTAPAETTPVTVTTTVTEDTTATEDATATEDTTATVATDAPPITAPSSEDESLSYPTLEDGSPAPIIAIFDGASISLSGVVPSEQASERLEDLAIANSNASNPSITDSTTINPDVPPDIGVRVAETESVRFDEGSSAVGSENAVELDRRVAILQALPDMTATVIAHGDQQGDDDADIALAAARAQSAVDYLIEQGVDPTRLSARAAEPADLLALNNDDIATDLDGRIEIVFFGLLIEP